MEYNIHRKMNETEENYYRNKRKLEETFDILSNEKYRFFRHLDQLAHQLQIISRKGHYDPLPPSTAYRYLEQAKHEGQQTIQHASHTLEH
ncbi:MULTISPECIES: hypothetical protein [unclassified Enterococcus]|uniref:hypothetical protein n=1 Tax=unclassified Enterococcus TaxID=2608891 RepID=UPI0013ED0480|nr:MULTISPECIES: hypothetical protein [unclassified Enterococcus]